MRTDVLAGFSPYVRVSGLFRREYIPYVCDAKARSRGVGPHPGTGASHLDKIYKMHTCQD